MAKPNLHDMNQSTNEHRESTDALLERKREEEKGITYTRFEKIFGPIAAGVIGVTVIGGILFGSDVVERRNREIYANFPITNVTANAGDTIDSFTAEGVDTCQYTFDIRRPQFVKDNHLKSAEDPIYAGKKYIRKVDPSYKRKAR